MYLTYVCKSLGLSEKITTSSVNINRNKLIPSIPYVGQFFLTKLISKTLTYKEKRRGEEIVIPLALNRFHFENK